MGGLVREGGDRHAEEVEVPMKFRGKWDEEERG